MTCSKAVIIDTHEWSYSLLCIILFYWILGYHSFCKLVPAGTTTISHVENTPLQNDCVKTSTPQTLSTSRVALIAVSMTSAVILILGLLVLVGLLIRKQDITCFVEENGDYRPLQEPKSGNP